MQKVLFPTDFSPMANHAFSYALSFAKHYDASIMVLHVYHYSEAEARLAPVDVLEDLHSIRKEETYEKFQFYQAQADSIGFQKLSIEPVFTSGFAGEMILETCEQLEAELIIMGSKGDGGFSDRIFGSVALRIMRDAPCPVMTIPKEVPFLPLRILFYAAASAQESNTLSPQLQRLREKLQAELSYVHIRAKGSKDIVGRLADIIAELEADAVLLSPNQHSFFENLLHPSITEQLTETLRIPIIAVH